MNIIKRIKRQFSIITSNIFYSFRFYSWGQRSIIIKPDSLFQSYAIMIGNMVEIRKGARLETIGPWDGIAPKIVIGDGTSIHPYFHCGAANSVTIGKNVLIAARVYITDHDHKIDDPEIPPIKSGLTISPVLIGDGVWIGEGAAILKGVTIGKRSVVGANAVVTKNVPPYTVVGGIPAKVIKKLKIQ